MTSSKTLPMGTAPGSVPGPVFTCSSPRSQLSPQPRGGPVADRFPVEDLLQAVIAAVSLPRVRARSEIVLPGKIAVPDPAEDAEPFRGVARLGSLPDPVVFRIEFEPGTEVLDPAELQVIQLVSADGIAPRQGHVEPAASPGPAASTGRPGRRRTAGPRTPTTGWTPAEPVSRGTPNPLFSTQRRAFSKPPVRGGVTRDRLSIRFCFQRPARVSSGEADFETGDSFSGSETPACRSQATANGTPISR